LREPLLWTEEQPSTETLASMESLASDTLTLEHWLPFIFLPTMSQLVETNASLSQSCAIAPMAEEHVKVQSKQLPNG